MKPLRRPDAVLAVLLTTCGAASAQDRLSLYANVDSALVSARLGGRSMTRVDSGLGSTTRWGITGNEDLGDGAYAGFWLESAFRTDTGVPGGSTAFGGQAFFNRQSNVTIGSKHWGEVKLGRQVPPQLDPFLDTFAGVTGFSPWASLASLSSDQGAGATVGDSRISNAVSYTSPSGSPLGGMVQVAFREVPTGGYSRYSSYGGELYYRRDALHLHAHATYNNTDPTAALPTLRNAWYGLGAKNVFGGVTASYMFTLLKPERQGYRISQTHVLGFTVPVGPHAIRVSPAWRHVNGDRSLNSFALGLGFDYNLSKTMMLYSRVGYVANRERAVASLSSVGAVNPGEDMSLVSFGIRVRF